VTEIEPLPESSPLWKLDNVLITPHISSWTPRYTDRLIEIFCLNLKAYLNKKPMPTLVDKEKGY
jgi:phosphoglycerate dehydrogenase-like enzyme